jgi:hypothetical protein
MSDEKEVKREKSDVKLDDLMGSDLKLTGADIPAGSYGVILFGFSEPFRMRQSDKFKKKDSPEFRDLFDLRFGLFDKSGSVVEQTYLCGIPDGGELNRRSNLYKALKAIGLEYFDKEGSLRKGTKLKDFIGKVGVANIEPNKDDWPQIKTIGGPLDGAKYPTLDQCKELLTSSPDVPF